METFTDIDDRISPSDGSTYWNSIPSTVDGMLGGYPQISRIDMRGSLAFIAKLPTSSPTSKGKLGDQEQSEPGPPLSFKFSRAADLGAGIGRITAGVLTRVAQITDIVEPVAKFAAQAKVLLLESKAGEKEGLSTGSGQLGEVYVTPLQDWQPTRTYDLIWIQWCLGHLTREQTVSSLERCRKALGAEGYIVVKENNSASVDVKGNGSANGVGNGDLFDEIDSSVTRTDDSYRALFEQAGLKIALVEVQKGFPAELFPVRMYALRAA